MLMLQKQKDLKLIHLNFFVKTLKEEEYNQSKQQKGNMDEKSVKQKANITVDQ